MFTFSFKLWNRSWWYSWGKRGNETSSGHCISNNSTSEGTLTVSLQEIISCCERIKRSLFKTEDEIAEVESQTGTQSTRQEWYKHRFGRVTALESHRVGCTHKVGTSPSKIIKEVLKSDNNYQSQAMTDDSTKLAAGERQLQWIDAQARTHKGHSNIMWFLQKKEKGSLGASPDGLIKDPSRKDPHGIFEAKYIILKGESLKDALSVFFLSTQGFFIHFCPRKNRWHS